MSAKQSELELTTAYAIDHPRLGLVNVSEFREYSRFFPEGGFWMRCGGFKIVIDETFETKDEKVYSLMAEIEREYWWPETIEL